MAILIFLLTPLVWASNPFEKMPYFIATYFSKPPISNFPIFPWMGYFFAGLFVTAVLRKSEKPWRTAVLFLCLGLILKPLVFYLKDLSLQYPAFQYPGDQNWWYSSPGHAVYRLSRVLVVYCGLFLTEQYWSRIRYLPKFFIFMGQESLIYYFWHIVIVYGTAANQGFRTLFHGTLNFSQMALATLAITLGLSVFAYPWHQLKKFYPKVAFWTLGGTIFLSLAYFFIS